MEKVQYTMIDRQSKKPGRSSERGAALVVAIAIMTILLAVALTFYAVSRQEVTNAENVKNQAQVDLLLDAAYAMGQAELNRDFLKHPNATSSDSAPFSLFNGSWAVGKQWALWNGVPLQAGGAPLVNLRAMPLLDFGDGLPPELMFNGGRSKDWLTIPRFEDPAVWGANPIAYANVLDDATGLPYGNIFNVADRNRAPFVTPAFYGPSGTDGFTDEKYPLEWIHTWTDVDNDLDGLNDAIWIPLPQDRFFSGGEVVDDATGRRMYDDGVDNDLDSTGINGYDELPEANEGAMELASFVYHGLGPDRRGDGLDNDGNGVVDDPANENKYFLTAPLPGLTILLDFNADGKVPDLVPNAVGVLVPITVTLPNTISVETAGGVVNLTATDVDAIDNDFDMLINDYQVYAYVGPNTNDITASGTFPPFQLTGFEDSGVANPVAPTPPIVGTNLIQINENVAANSSLAVGDPFYLTTWRSPGEWPADDRGLFTTAILRAYEDINVETAIAPNGGLRIEPANAVFHAEPGIVSNFDYTLLEPAIRITHSGEPVCDLAGRAAITIRDEASKVNVNVAGGQSYDPLGPAVPELLASTRLGGLIDTGYYRSLGLGNSAAEFETRTLPGVGVVEAAQLWLQRTGVPGGDPTGWEPSVTTAFNRDVIYPGYGRVDDNANAIIAALNGRDDDGDGLVDEGLYLPQLSAVAQSFIRGGVLTGAQVASAQAELQATRYAEYFGQLGAFEGVDEPGELQRFNPASNLVAEGRNPYDRSGLTDGLDNDLDGAINELGELGDLQLQDTLQLEEIFGLGTGTTAALRQSVTTFSTDRNTNFIGGQGGIRAINKLDFNFATPQQIAANLVLANNFQSVTAAPVATAPVANRFAEGLRQKDVHIRASGGLLNNSATFFPADPVLQAMQAAVDIVDNRDPGHTRSVLSTERQKLSTDGLELANYDFFPTRLGARERTADTELFPLGVLEDHLRNTLELNRKLEVKDDWWTFEAAVTGENGRPEVREISYTAAGSEAIRINELMVRPVRRIEAEAVPVPTAVLDPSDPMTAIAPALLPNFDPSPDFGFPAAPSILPEFAVARLTTPLLNGWNVFNGGVLGEASYLGISMDNTVPATLVDAADILEFVIAPTDGLPPGRYYLTINTTTNTGATTVVPINQLIPALAAFNEPLLQSAVKYRSKTSGLQDGNSIVQDIVLGAADGFQNIDDAQIGGQIPGAPAGWTFVDGTRGGFASLANYHFDGYVEGLFNNQATSGSETFTITVPEAASDFELHIAFRVNPNFVTALANPLNPPLTYTVAINSLDFSQEPDHEWVELVNVSDDIVDIGGWQLEVGIPDRPSVPSDPFKSIWTIPANTEIAPRGMVLLAFNKFDSFKGAVPADHRIADNGMGLADGDSPNPLVTAGFLSDALTVPPIGDNSLASIFPTLQDVTGSVFRRKVNPATNALTDYVDNDGDGRTSLNAPTDTDNLANEGTLASSKALGSFFSNSSGNLPWDRIIQLESVQIGTANPFTATPTPIRLDEVDTLDDVSAFVLKGGVLPNYPERDGFDNDGDGGYVLFEQIDERTQNGALPGYVVGTAGADGFPDWIDASRVPGVPAQYIPGTLDMDMVDNDFDGFVDERPYQADFFGIGVDSVFYRASLSEGVDEGRNLVNNVLAVRRFGAGSFEAGIMPFSLFPDRLDWNTAYSTGVPNAPFTVDSIVPSGLGLQHGINAGYNIYGDNTVIPTAIPTSYQGSDLDPQDWKAFSERRWYPGDNVIVTLYEKSQLERQVVDRVTYREADVTNRTIDDVVAVPYVSVDLDGSGTPGDVLIEQPGLNARYRTFWLPNQMGLDFYRSLERKDPLYNGDRFGTENRWQATDGNYDDWADSLSYFEAELGSVNPGLTGTDTLVISANPADVQDIRPRFVGTHPAFTNVDVATVARNLQLYGHAMSGSPLRMNAAMRRGHNPRDLELIAAAATDTRQFPSRPGFQGPFDYFRTHEDGAFNGANPLKNALRLPGDTTANTKSLPDQRWNHSRTFVANRAFQSPADLMRVPHQMYLHDAVDTPANPNPLTNIHGYLHDMTMLNYNLQGDSGPGDGISVTQDIALRGATLGQDLVDDTYSQDLLTAAMNSMAVDSTVLTMGQAELRPIRPEAVTLAEVDWVPTIAGGGPDTWLAPAAWTPVFLFGLGSDTAAPSNPDHFSNYPSYVNGANAGVSFPLYYLFDSDYITDPANFAGNNVYDNNNLDSRWPLEKRTAMFVSEKRDGFAPPEALFTWDGADGLENGEYVLYIGTFLPQMRERIEEAARASAQVRDLPAQGIEAKNTTSFINNNTPVNYVLSDGSVVPVNAVTNNLLIKDPTNPRKDPNGRLYDPVYAIDVITDPTEARGIAPQLATVADPSAKPAGLIHPDDWNPTVQYRAGADGYIPYGNNTSGGWQPQIVRVTDNFLAIRVRNVGLPGDVGVLTHVVLSPRKRTAGRVNINTVQQRVSVQGANHDYFSTLLGLPGVVNVAQTVYPTNVAGTTGALGAPIPADDPVGLMRYSGPLPVDGSWTAPDGAAGFYAGGPTPPTRNRFTGDVLNPDSDLLVPNTGLPSMAAHQLGAFRLSAMIAGGRTEHADGRYYESVGDLTKDSNAFDYNYTLSRMDVPDLTGTGTDGVEDWAVYPLSNDAVPARRFDEIQARLRAMGNLITVRSDVFEIIMTVEAGYGIDQNKDGFINYRDRNEFVTTAATKATATYERRAPSDQSDSGE